ncbi:MAG: hypothetical protein WBZ33_06955, partial [Thermoactinomyces sp.]
RSINTPAKIYNFSFQGNPETADFSRSSSTGRINHRKKLKPKKDQSLPYDADQLLSRESLFHKW